jgi:hypothetical protein
MGILARWSVLLEKVRVSGEGRKKREWHTTVGEWLTKWGETATK